MLTLKADGLLAPDAGGIVRPRARESVRGSPRPSSSASPIEGRLPEGLVADVIAVPGDPLRDITVTQDVRFVMKGGKAFVR